MNHNEVSSMIQSKIISNIKYKKYISKIKNGQRQGKNILFKKRLYYFILRLIKYIKSIPDDRVTRIIGDQLLRSGTSILANYIEATSSSSRKDYTNYFHHSLKSSNESKVWLALLRDLNYGSREENKWLLQELDEISQIFASSIITLKGRRNI